MTDNSKVLESLMESAYVPAINDHRDHDALVVAILMYLMAQGGEHKEDAVGLIHTTAFAILEKMDEITQSCSFCGEKPPKVKLAAGGMKNTSYICNSCVDMLHTIFHKKADL